MYPLIIFDWDGTLADSVPIIVKSVQSAIKYCQFSEPHPDEIKNLIGLGLDDAIHALFPKSCLHEKFTLVEAYKKAYLAYTEHEPEPLFLAVRETIERLKLAGYSLAIATGKGRRGLERSLHQHKLNDVFLYTRCADESNSKPHPQMLRDILAATGFHKKQAVMVGDTTYDMQMAESIGMVRVGVTYGVHSVSELQKHSPAHIINAIDQLETWLSNP